MIVGRIISGQSFSKIIIRSLRVGVFKNDNDHRSKETWTMFELPIHNKNNAVNVLLRFLFGFFIITLHLTKLSFFNIDYLSLTLSSQRQSFRGVL